MSKYAINDSTMTGIADAVRGLRHEKQSMTPAQIEAKIKETQVGAPVAMMSDHMVNGKWVRPAEYPDLDALKAQIPEGEDCVYLTYDLRKTPGDALLSIRVNAPSGDFHVDRGHVEEGLFVVDETNDILRNNAFMRQLSEEDGEIQLWRVTCDSKIGVFGFSGWSSDFGRPNTQMGYQPCVECAGRLSDPDSIGSNGTTYTGSVFTSGGTFWLERHAIAYSGSVQNMASAFRECYALQEIVMEDWDTSQWTVTNMSQAFYLCRSLQSLDLGCLDTRNWQVTNMNQAWMGCFALRYLNLHGVDTSNWSVTNMQQTFSDCPSLLELDLTTFNTSNWNVVSIYNLFDSDISLVEIKGLNDLDTSNWHLTSIASSGGYGPFNNCRSLREIDISNWDTSNFAITQAHTWFNGTFSCTTIKCPLDMGDAESTTNGSPNYNGLINFNGFHNYANHSYAFALSLTRQSLINIIGNLPTVTSARTITLGGHNKQKLTDAEIAVATQKGWTVAT